MTDVVVGSDGRARCAWATSAPEYVAYHDDEWGQPLDVGAPDADRRMFERLSLEAFQSGLSWLVILRKREAFRAAFADFDIETVAGFGPGDVDRLLADAGIVRNRAKIEATIDNAAAAAALDDGLARHIAAYVGGPRAHPRSLADVPSQSAESQALAKDLRRRGFRFVGPTTLYALMQATGLVDDHVAGCWRVGA